MPGYLEGSEEDGGEESESDYYAYGSTPKTRTAMKPVPRTRSTGKIEGKRSAGGKPGRTASSKAVEPSQALARQSRNMSAARRESKGRRQKARQQARFFKEIDTTLEALGIGTAADATGGAAAAGPGGGPAGGGTGMPPSPVSSTLSLSLALSSDPHMGALTPTAMSSRAGTPPPSGPGGLGAAPAAGPTGVGGGGGDAGGSGIGRRVTSEMSLRSSDLQSGCSTPERHPSVVGLAGGGAIARAAWGGSRSSLTGIHSDPSTATLHPGPRAGPVAVPALAAASASEPALGQIAAAAAGPAAAAVAPAAAAMVVAVDRRRTTGTAAALPPPSPHRRSASYEDAAAAAAVAAAAVAVPYHQPTPSRAGWAVAPSDRDEFRRQLGSVLVGHGLTGEELEAGVAEAEERGEALSVEISALMGEAEALGPAEEAEEEAAGLGKARPSTFPFRWTELSELITCLDDLYRRSKEALRKVKPYKTLLAEDPDLLPRLRDLALKLLAGLAEAAEALGAAACRGLRCLGALGSRRRGSSGLGLGLGLGYGTSGNGGEDDVRLAGRVVRRLMDALDFITKKIGDELGGTTDAAATELLNRCKAVYLDLAQAGIQAASRAAPVLLDAASLSADSFAHEKSSQARRLAALWDESARQTDRVGRRYGRHRLALYGDMCEVYGTAGKLALAMTQGAAGQGAAAAAAAGEAAAALRSLEGDDDDDDGAAASVTSTGGAGGAASSVLSYASVSDGPAAASAALGGVGGAVAPAGAWGGAATAWGGGGRVGVGAGGAGGATDREIQAQAWVPGLLQVLLNRASDAHRILRNELAAADAARERERERERDPEGPEGAVLEGRATAGSELGQLPLLGSGGGSGSAGGGGLDPWLLSDARLEELWWLLDEMQQSFAELCVANLKRTVRLCGGGAGKPLPLWALELARDAAESALRFIHTHEHSSMALGDLLEMEEELAAEMQNWLRTTWTDITGLTTDVVNGLLSIRRQINVRRSGQISSAANDAAAAAGPARAQAAPSRSAAWSAVATAGGGGGGRGGAATAAGRGGGGASHAQGRPPTAPTGQGRRGGGGAWTAAAPAGGLSKALRGGGPQQPTQQRQPAGGDGGSGMGQSGCMPSRDPNTHVYDKAYDEGKKQRPPLRRPVSPEGPSLRAVPEATVTPEASASANGAAPAAGGAPGPWLAALLTPATEAAAAAPGARSIQNSIDTSGPSRPGGSGTSVSISVGGRSGVSQGSSAVQHSAGGPTSGSQRMAVAAAAARRRSQPVLSGAGGRGGGAGGGSRGAGGRGRLFGRGRQGRRRDEDEDEAEVEHSDSGSVAGSGSALQEGLANAAQQGQGQGLHPGQRRWNDVSDGGSVRDDGASDCSSTAAAPPTAATTALQPATPSYASVTRGKGGGGGLSAAMAAAAGAAARPSAAPLTPPLASMPSAATVAVAVAGSSPPPASPTAVRSPFAVPSSTAHRIAGVPPPPAPSSPPSIAATATIALRSPFGAALAQQLQPSSASPSRSRSPFSSRQTSPHPSPPPSPLRPGNANGAAPAQPPSPPPAAAQPPPAAAVPIAVKGAAATATAAAAATAAASVTLAFGSPARVAAVGGGVSSGGSPGAGPGGGGANSGSSSFQFAPSRPDSAAPAGREGSSAGAAASGSPDGVGHWTLRLGSPKSSGPVMPAGSHCESGGAAPAAATPAPPFAVHQRNGQANGDAANHHHHHHDAAHRSQHNSTSPQTNNTHQQHHHHHHQQQQQQQQQGRGTGTGAAASVTALRAPSLTTQFSLSDQLARYDSYGLGLAGGGDSLNVLDLHRVSSDAVAAGMFGDPELAALLRTIASDPFWDIRWKDLSHGLSNIVGLGSTGQVFSGMYLHAEVAIKVIPINRETKYDVRALRAFKAEVDLNKRLNNHPNIVRFIGVCAEYIQHAARQAGILANDGPAAAAAAGSGAGAGGRPSAHPPATTGGSSQPFSAGPSPNSRPMLAIVMEFCHLGTLYDMIGEAQQFASYPGLSTAYRRYGLDFFRRWERRLEVLCGAAAGLEYMHRCSVIHHDFTSYNLLLEERNSKWITKVCDFNLSREVPHGGGAAASLTVPNSGRYSSPRWQSPEYLAGEEYGWATDVFSFAVVVWEVVTLKRPWDKEMQGVRFEPIAIHTMYTDGKRLAFPLPEALRPPLPELPQLVELCNACWHLDPRQRPRMSEVAEQLFGLLATVRVREEARREAVRRDRALAQGTPGGPAGAGTQQPHTARPPAALPLVLAGPEPSPAGGGVGLIGGGFGGGVVGPQPAQTPPSPFQVVSAAAHPAVRQSPTPVSPFATFSVNVAPATTTTGVNTGGSPGAVAGVGGGVGGGVGAGGSAGGSSTRASASHVSPFFAIQHPQ